MDELCMVATDRDGRSVELNAAAASLLKISIKGLERHPRTFGMFFDVSRPVILKAQAAARSTVSDRILALLRPREHAPVLVVITVLEASDGYLEWTINSTESAVAETGPDD